MKSLKIGDKIRVGVGQDYCGFPATVTKVILREWPRHYEQYEVQWDRQGGFGHVDQIFCTDWVLEKKDAGK